MSSKRTPMLVGQMPSQTKRFKIGSDGQLIGVAVGLGVGVAVALLAGDGV